MAAASITGRTQSAGSTESLSEHAAMLGPYAATVKETLEQWTYHSISAEGRLTTAAGLQMARVTLVTVTSCEASRRLPMSWPAPAG